MQILHMTNGTGGGAPRGMLETFRQLYFEEGLAVFYRGLTASFLGLTHVAIQVRCGARGAWPKRPAHSLDNTFYSFPCVIGLLHINSLLACVDLDFSDPEKFDPTLAGKCLSSIHEKGARQFVGPDNAVDLFTTRYFAARASAQKSF